MQSFGEAILRFGDSDLFLRVFHAVQREYMNQSQHSFGQRKQGLIDGAYRIESLTKKLSENVSEYQVEQKNL